MNKALAELIHISNVTGRDSALVQGGGGNTSVKTADGRYMYIKASGTALKDMNEKAGWRRLKLDSVLSIINDKAISRLDTHRREPEVVNRLLLACQDQFGTQSRPSVEAHLHALLDRCVIHLHPTMVGAYVNAKNGKAELEKLFSDQRLPILWVPYADPGFMLAKRISRLVRDYRQQYGIMPRILFLEKHGLFVTAQQPAKALQLVFKVINRCRRVSSAGKRKVRRAKRAITAADFDTSGRFSTVCKARLGIRRAFFEATGRYIQVRRVWNNTIEAFSRHKNARKMLSVPALTPDELIYAHGPAMWVEQNEIEKITSRLTTQISKGDKPALAFLVQGSGLFVAGREKMAATLAEVMESSFLVRTYASRLGGISALSRRERAFIEQWESEAFRVQLATGSQQGPLHGRIAVVSGGGSGLGSSIAVGLAAAGASVAVLDIDAKAAEQTCQTARQRSPQADVCALSCDVTSQDSVCEAFAKLLGNWGGLDIAVNAAGIAPAYPLTELPVEKFRAAIEVNLTGYFLIAKAAATIMKQQAIGGCIINISSKSGLEASIDNTAYNTTKAGELHMARGWALELGKYGIRVNSVCPGNVFEGSKIWNAQYIRVCAKKHGIKPGEVIPYYVNKTSLKREIKGQDIADSVVFLCSDKARTITGQTLVADSGQVMVR